MGTTLEGITGLVPKPLGETNRMVLFCAQYEFGQCVVSGNNGRTWTSGQYTLGTECSRGFGHARISEFDGLAVVPARNCVGTETGGRYSYSNGVNWASYVIPGSTQPADGFEPAVGLATSGENYQAWTGADYHPYVASSPGGLSAWGSPVDLGQLVSPRVKASTFQNVVVGDKNRVAVTFLGSPTGGDPFNASWHGVWYYYAALSFDGGHTWTTSRLSEDPVQRGFICSAGITCTSGRNLLDFNDARLDNEGRLIVAFADGCVDACAELDGAEETSTSAWATILRQDSGLRLRSNWDPAATVPDPVLLAGAPGPQRVSLSWDPADPNGSPVSGYRIYRNAGGGYQLLTSTSSTEFTDTSLTDGDVYKYRVGAVNSLGESVGSNEVEVVPGTAPEPDACFTADLTGRTLVVSASCSTGTGARITAYNWSWGDGSQGNGRDTQHTYASAGSRSVGLVITDANNASAEYTAEVDIP